MKYSKFIENSKISKICFGTWNLSPSTKKFASPTTSSPSQSIKLLRYALDKGINFFDTAELYSVPPTPDSYGKTEIMIGNWFKKRKNRDKIIVDVIIF